MARTVMLSTSDTDLLSARECGADYAVANPARLDVAADLPAILSGAELVVVRILGSARSWQDGLDAVRASGTPVVVLGGEQTPDAELMSHSTVPVGTAAEAHRYLAEGGPGNLAQLHAFLSDTVLLTGEGFEPPEVLPGWGTVPRRTPESGRARVGVLFYRAHHTSGNSAFVDALAHAIDAIDDAVAVPVFASSLRNAPDDLLAELSTLDALVVTVLAAGGTKPANASAGGDDESWDVEALAKLDIPILQGLCLTWPRDTWADSDDGLSPLDAATQVAVPEFDGRIITVPFSFKETDADGLPYYVADPERCARVAGIAAAHARLRHTPPERRRVAVMLSAYPTKHSRVGNAVGLDTPVSAVRLLRALRDQGYDLGDGLPGLDPLPPVDGED
ncbi:MAG: cobaltochelatase subunit CobN, partial [Nocardioidaceae bacterium]